jgi:histone H3/H4
MGVRHKRTCSLSPVESGIGRPSIRRLARRGGVKRLSGLIYDAMRVTATEYLESVIKRSLLYLETRVGRDGGVLTAMDVIYALKSAQMGGITFYSDIAK